MRTKVGVRHVRSGGLAETVHCSLLKDKFHVKMEKMSQLTISYPVVRHNDNTDKE